MQSNRGLVYVEWGASGCCVPCMQPLADACVHIGDNGWVGLLVSVSCLAKHNAIMHEESGHNHGTPTPRLYNLSEFA
jgi:hypothetical protein